MTNPERGPACRVVATASVAFLGTKLFKDAQTVTSVPSTVKCSSESNGATSGCSMMPARNFRAISAGCEPPGPRTRTTTPSSNQIHASPPPRWWRHKDLIWRYAVTADFFSTPASGSDPCDDPRLASRPAAMPLLPASRMSTATSDQIQALNDQKAQEFDQQNYAEWP